MHQQVEILVHVSAPSHGNDDTRYRKEAKRFLDFKPVNRVNILNGKLPVRREQFPSSQRDVAPVDESLGPSQKTGNLRQLFQKRLEDGRPRQAHGEQHALLASALGDHLTSPAVPRTNTKATAQLLIERTPAVARPRTAPDVGTSHAGFQTLRRTQSDSWQTPPSVIPDSQPSQNTSRLQVASSPISKRCFQSSSPSPSKDLSPTTKRARRLSPSALYDEGDSQESSLSYRPPAEILDAFTSSSSQEQAPRPASETDLPLEIHPPKPRIANAHFTTHLTPSLKNLAIKSPLSKFFLNGYSTRPIDPLERGHWLIDLSSWDTALKSRFWSFLAGFIGGGFAGWGIWCIRELVRNSTRKSSDKKTESPGREEVLKVYCWGEVVREIWLGLYGGSEKMIQKVGARWIDAGGNIVVEMKGDGS